MTIQLFAISIAIGIFVYALWRLYIDDCKGESDDIKVTNDPYTNDIIDLVITADMCELMSSTHNRFCRSGGDDRERQHLNRVLIYERIIVLFSTEELIIGFITGNHEYTVIGRMPFKLIYKQTKSMYERRGVCSPDGKYKPFTIPFRCNDSVDINNVIASTKPHIVPFIARNLYTSVYGYALLQKTTVSAKFGLLDSKIYYKVNNQYVTSEREIGNLEGI